MHLRSPKLSIIEIDWAFIGEVNHLIFATIDYQLKILSNFIMTDLEPKPQV